MIIVEIKNLDGVITHSGRFDSDEQADIWINKHESNETPWNHNPGNYSVIKTDLTSQIALEASNEVTRKQDIIAIKAIDIDAMEGSANLKQILKRLIKEL